MNRSFSKYILALLLFGSNGVFANMISLGSYEIVLLRSLLGSLFVVSVFFIGRNKPTFPAHKKSFLFLCVGGCATGTTWILLYEAYQRISVSIATLCMYFGPAIVMALSPFLFKEKLTCRKTVSFLLVLLGMVLISGQLAGSGSDIPGLLCGIFSAVTYAAAIICNKCAKEIGGLENTAIQLVFAFITAALFVGMTRGFSMQAAPSDILPVLVLGLINTGIGSYLFLSSMNVLPVQTVAICGYLEPLSAVIFSLLFLHETLLPLQLVGACLILGGAIFGELRQKPPAKEAAQPT